MYLSLTLVLLAHAELISASIVNTRHITKMAFDALCPLFICVPPAMKMWTNRTLRVMSATKPFAQTALRRESTFTTIAPARHLHWMNTD